MTAGHFGARTLPSQSTIPAFSAILRKPSHRVSVPNKSTMTSTDSLAMAKMLSTIAAKTPAFPPTSHCARAEIAATTKNPSHRPFSIQIPSQDAAMITAGEETTNPGGGQGLLFQAVQHSVQG
jgi:hypothetical protein